MHDIFFRIGDRFAIHSYGVMAMIGFLAALFVARWRARRAGLLPDEVTDICVWALLAGIVGSRIAYVLQNTDYFFDTARPGWSVLDLLKIWQGGLVFYGGLIGALVVTLLLLRAKKLKTLPVLDVLTPSLALGHAFGRIGCYLHGCCYGVPVHQGAWYGCVFPRDSLPYLTGVGAPLYIAPGTPLWPTQLVSAFDLFCIFIILSLFFRHQRRSGEVTALYLLLYSTERFIVEFFRGDTHLPGQMSEAQWISIGIFIAGAALMAWLKTSTPEKVPARK
ncbi:MAG: prolipoprotein diacylglyceryl transferase [Candidatus Brocadiia bacterium]|jgi:phosphatidylglycerol:prolipoprotein diacylglycerol transferase